MSDEVEYDDMTPEEKREVAADMQASQRRIAAQRKETQQQTLLAGYRREIKAAQGQPHLGREIRAKYEKMGLDVSNVHFTV